MSRRTPLTRNQYTPRFENLENRIVPSLTPYFDTVLADNPESYWRINENSGPTAIDSSGNGNNGTYNGNIVFGQPGALEHGSDSAAQFDGQTAFAMFDNTISGSFTVEAWIKTTANSRTGTQGYHGNAIVWSDVAHVHNDWIVAVLNNHLSFFTGKPDNTIEGTTDLNDGQWHHIVATRIQGGQKSIYVDGQLEAVGSTNNSLLNDGPVIAVGGNSLDSRSFNGNVDEVALYNYAMTSEQVLTHYLSGLNRLPIAQDDEVVTSEGTPISFDPRDNDFDPDGHLLTFGEINQPSNGTVTVHDNGTPDDATDDFLVYMPNPGFFGDDSFGYQVVDPLGGSATANVFISVDPETPVVQAGSDESINEGDTFARAGSFTDPGVNTWTATVDYGDGSGPQELPLTFDKTFTLQHQFTDNGTFTVTVTVMDDDNHTGTASFVVTVNNMNPDVLLVGPDFGVRGQPRQFVISANDISSEDNAAGFEYVVDWGDGSPVQFVERTAGNGDGVDLQHIFTHTGEYTVHVTAFDKDNGESAAFTHTIHITVAGLQDDPLNPGQKMLVVGGTLEDDSIMIRPGRHNRVFVTINGVVVDSFLSPSRVVVYSQTGDDFVQVAGPLRKSASIHTGDNDDFATGQSQQNAPNDGGGKGKKTKGAARFDPVSDFFANLDE